MQLYFVCVELKSSVCGFRSYDVMLEPRIVFPEIKYDAFILEFKVQDAEEKELSDAVQAALRQIETQNYKSVLMEKGIPEKHIKKYGFAFCGKKVLIGNILNYGR